MKNHFKIIALSVIAFGLMTSAASARGWDDRHHYKHSHYHRSSPSYSNFSINFGTPVYRHRYAEPRYYPVVYHQPVVIQQPAIQQISFSNPYDEGNYCREYQAVSIIAGRRQSTYGTACMQPDGSWQIRN